MNITKQGVAGINAIKFIAEEQGKAVGRAYLYILKNDLHKEPFAFLEDLFVEEEFRSKGIGSQILQSAVEEAKAQGCYKLIFTSREANEKLHGYYASKGFKKYGFEFRMNF